MAADRPDPDRLLALVARDGAAGKRGRLKVYLGAAPGVGKTFAMLTAARRLAAAGHDVVVGAIETHGRSETAALLLGLPQLPHRTVVHGGRTFLEFDLDAALQRRPQLLLVDELAHTNLAGGRHEKRWQDVDELLAAGIDVHTTLNVQHLDSLVDIVARVTGVQVRETVPDAVLDRADEVELVDLPPDTLLERLRQGKVYAGETADRALQSFFRRGNLVALRELALRRTAQRVDAELADYRRAKGVHAVWPIGERVLVCISPSPHSQDLLRAAHRLAVAMQAPLFAVFVHSPQRPLHRAADRDRVLQHLALAESLGARVQTLQGEAPAAALVAFAREHNVQRIFVGKTRQGRLQELLRGSFTTELIRRSGDIEIVVLGGGAATAAMPTANAGAADAPVAREIAWAPWIWIAATMALATGAAWVVYAPPDLSAEALLLLLGVVATALRHGRGPAAAATMIAVLAFNFLFTEPRFSFAVDDRSHLVTFAILLAVGWIVGTLAERVRREASAARTRQQETEELYSLARVLADATTDAAVAHGAADHLADVARADVVIVLADDDGELPRDRVAATAGDSRWFDDHEFGIARLCFDQDRPAGRSTADLPGAAALHLPLVVDSRRLGVVALRLRPPAVALQPRQRLLLDTLVHQIAHALLRLRLLREGHEARARADTERLRNALLTSVSHDLRTPLATIRGAASVLVDRATAANSELHDQLAHEIQRESERLDDLIGNVVHATRLESDRVDLRRQWTAIEEVIGNALRRIGTRLHHHRVRTSVPPALPLLAADPVLLEQACFNLLDNIARHTPAATAVTVGAAIEGKDLVLAIDDDGPGRSLASPSPGTGLGLGLVVVRGIVTAHGGTMVTAHGDDGRGTRIRIRLPLPPEQPSMPPASSEP